MKKEKKDVESWNLIHMETDSPHWLWLWLWLYSVLLHFLVPKQTSHKALVSDSLVSQYPTSLPFISTTPIPLFCTNHSLLLHSYS